MTNDQMIGPILTFASDVALVAENHVKPTTPTIVTATAFQTREVLDAMEADSGVKLAELRVDGGMTANKLLMQFQADLLDTPVILPEVAETTALGAAYAAGIAVGFWDGEQDVIDNWNEAKRWTPNMDADERDRQLRMWKKAVTKTLDWVDDDVK